MVVEPEAFFERGDQIAVFLLVRSRPRDSNAVIENRIAHVWKLRDGKALRLQVFAERDQALEAVGMARQDVRAES